MSDTTTHANKVVLVAEDSAHDRGLLRYAVAAAGSNLSFQFVNDGVEVVSYLRAEGQYANRKLCPAPDILVLDMKMPRMDGMQVLDWIEASKDFSHLKVVVLTGSGGPDLRDLSKGRNARFLHKPDTLDMLIEIVRGLERV